MEITEELRNIFEGINVKDLSDDICNYGDVEELSGLMTEVWEDDFGDFTLRFEQDEEQLRVYVDGKLCLRIATPGNDWIAQNSRKSLADLI